MRRSRMNADTFIRTVYHRRVTTDDSYTLSVALRKTLLDLTKGSPDDRLNSPFNTSLAPTCELMFWCSGEDNATFQATVYGLPSIVQRVGPVPAQYGITPIRLLSLSLTAGTLVNADVNPITGDSDAGVTWRAIDTLVVTLSATGDTVYDGAGGNGQARILFDPIGCPLCFVSIHNKSSSPASGTIICAVRIIGTTRNVF